MHQTSYFPATALLIAGLMLGTQAAEAPASVLRCKTADGRISYQDSSCPNGARGEPVDDTPNQGFEFATKQQIRKAMRPPPEERRYLARNRQVHTPQALNAGERRFILPGLAAAEVRQRIGAPDHVVYKSSSYGKRPSRDASQRWIYLPAADDPQTTTTVSVKGGMVLHVDRRVTR